MKESIRCHAGLWKKPANTSSVRYFHRSLYGPERRVRSGYTRKIPAALGEEPTGESKGCEGHQSGQHPFCHPAGERGCCQPPVSHQLLLPQMLVFGAKYKIFGGPSSRALSVCCGGARDGLHSQEGAGLRIRLAAFGQVLIVGLADVAVQVP